MNCLGLSLSHSFIPFSFSKPLTNNSFHLISQMILYKNPDCIFLFIEDSCAALAMTETEVWFWVMLHVKNLQNCVCSHVPIPFLSHHIFE